MPRRRTNSIRREVNVTAHLANERTYLSWMRTGVIIITLGFAIAKFGLAFTNSPIETSVQYSSVVAMGLVLLGGSMELFALKRYRNRQVRINEGSYESTTTFETYFSVSAFLLAVLILARILVGLLFHY